MTAPYKGPVAKKTVEPESIDGSVSRSKVADDVSAILRTPIVTGGRNEEDTRESRAQQAYGNDPVHEPRFDTALRMAGPLAMSISTLEVDGEEYALGWVRCKLGGETDTANVSNAALAGYRPCPINLLPGYLKAYAFKSDLGDNLYIINDAMLMMIPMHLKNALDEQDQRKADFRMRRVEENEEFLDGLPRDSAIQSRARPAVRETITGRHATAAVQDALDSAAQEHLRHPAAQQHAVRGFRVRR